MMSSLWLQVGPSYGMSKGVEDWWLREWEKRSRAESGLMAVEEVSEAPARRWSLGKRMVALASAIAHMVMRL